MISDQQRREVAQKLREACDEIERTGNGLTVWELTDILSIRDDDSGMIESLNLDDARNLADLIDCPTCEDIGDFDHEAFKCSRCGYRMLSLRGIANNCPSDAVLVTPDGLITEFAYCPNCGAEVANDA